MNKQYITKYKRDELISELERLKTVERKKIADKLEYARNLGDLSENAEYHDAREAQSELEARIEHIESILNSAEIIKNAKSDEVTLGSKVVVKKERGSVEIEYEIVGSAEVDLSVNKVSHESPLGGAMLGKKVGDVVELKTPKGVVRYIVVKIM